jgi:hypothetical protein
VELVLELLAAGYTTEQIRQQYDHLTAEDIPACLAYAREADSPEACNEYGRRDVIYDRQGRTLTVWLTDNSREYVCQETGEEVVLMKDATGRVIGFEKLNFSIPDSKDLRVEFETVPA